MTNVNGRGFVSYENGIDSKRWGLNFSYCTLRIFGVRKGRFLDSQEGSFLALAFNGGGVNVALWSCILWRYRAVSGAGGEEVQDTLIVIMMSFLSKWVRSVACGTA